jgi:hypothetical protein
MPITVTDHLLDLVKEEKAMLRAELLALKECQIKFLNSAIVSVGVILGLPELLALVNSGHQLKRVERFLGWENAVGEYRAWERDGRFNIYASL